jgi:hypothetical protein
MSATRTLNPEGRLVARPSGTPGPISVSIGLLLPQDRIPRESLGDWAARLAKEIEASRVATRQARRYAGSIAGLANNAALVATYEGGRREAWELCERQVTWQGRMSRRAKDPSIAAHGIQPWVNLGRLETMAGNWKAALARFDALPSFRLDGWITFGCIRLTRDQWDAVANSRETLERTLDATYVVDSFKTLLINRRWEETLAFAARFGEDGDRFFLHRADEAVVVASARLGDLDRARHVATEAARRAGGWPRAVFRLRLAEVLGTSGDLEGAREVLRPIAAVMAQVSPERKHDSAFLYPLLRLTTACAETGLVHEAAALAKDVLAGARTTADEVFAIESLRVLAVHAPVDERGAFREELDRLEETTEYEKYRKGGRATVRDPRVDGLYGLLGEVFAG